MQQPAEYPTKAAEYPPQPSQYPPQPGQYPPQPGQYPPQPGQYPPQPAQYPPQPVGSPPPYGPHQVPGQTVVVMSTGAPGACPYCGGYYQDEFTCCGICLGICFFPIGLICCFLMRERRCAGCGR